MANIEQKQTNRSLIDGTTPLQTTINTEITKKLASYPTKASITTLTKLKPTFVNGWANQSTANVMEYYKQLDNTLTIQGIIANTTTPTHVGTITTLATGNFPKTKQSFVVRTNNGTAEVSIDTAGVVSLVGYIAGASPTAIHMNMQVSLL